MDEPYSAIHGGLRRKLWLDMKILHSRFKTTVIHVTHDLEEAFALGHRAAVFTNGSIMQIGTQEEIMRDPANRSVAEFLGVVNIFSGKVTATEGETMEIVSRGLKFAAPLKAGVSSGEVDFCIHADQIVLGDVSMSAPHLRVAASVIGDIQHSGGSSVYLKIEGDGDDRRQYDLEVQLPEVSEDFPVGRRVDVVIPASAVHVL